MSPRIHIYADGSFLPDTGTGGWACCLTHKGKFIEICGSMLAADSFAAEMTAVVRGVRALPVGAKAILTTDHRASIKGISQFRVDPSRLWLNPIYTRYSGLWDELEAQLKLKWVHFEWSGRNSHPYLQRCDTLSRMCATGLAKRLQEVA